MRAWIVTAAPISARDLDFYRSVKPQEGDMVICADGGFDNAIQFAMQPDLVIGDFDSVASRVPEKIEIMKFPSEKDKTDTQLAVEHALERGAKEVVILGNLSGRFDHTLGVIFLLGLIKDRGAEGLVLSASERICLLRNEKAVIARGESKWISLVAVNGDAKGVSVKRTKYELDGEELKAGDTKGISNEFTALDAHVEVEKGEVLVVASG